jgi:histidine triad (HIT) family protein
MLPEEQIQQIKEQLIQQIDSTFPEDKKEPAKQQIESMNSEQLEEFLKQNKLIKTSQEDSSTHQCIFCSIISGDTQSYPIDENKDSIAVLEINPISKAHTIIIPKQHISSSEKLPQTVFSLAKKIAKKIKTKLKPKDIKISSSNFLGHEIINILPVYENETLDSKRYQEKPEELQKLQKLLEKKQKIKTVKRPKTKKLKEKLWLPRRIP